MYHPICPDAVKVTKLKLTRYTGDSGISEHNPYVMEGTCPKCNKVWYVARSGQLIPKRIKGN